MAGWTGDGHRHLRRRFWYGTMRNNPASGGGDILPIDGPPDGSLGRIDLDGAVTRVDGPFGISNTLAWSPDHRSIRSGDTLDVVFAHGCHAESGTGRDRRVHAPRDAAPGLPDGEFAG